jgi:DNA topoisomerase-1
MEKAGIGRPSTYAAILEKLFVKKYVVLGTNPQCDIEVKDYAWKEGASVAEETRKIHLGGTEKDRLVPTSLGYRVVEYIAEAYPALLDLQFTSKMESELDEISRGQRGKKEALSTFYGDFHPSIQRQLSSLQAVKEKTDKTQRDSGDNKPHHMKVLQSWPTLRCDMVETKYGIAIYDIQSKSFLSVEPFLAWKNKKQHEVSESDVQFLQSFPRNMEGSTRTLVWGPYGLYVKDGKKNLTLPKESWNAVENGTLDAASLNQLSWTPKKRSFGARAARE